MEIVISALEKNINYQKYLKLNPDKCHFLATKQDSNRKIKIEAEAIYDNKLVKLLSITIDNKLEFN